MKKKKKTKKLPTMFLSSFPADFNMCKSNP